MMTVLTQVKTGNDARKNKTIEVITPSINITINSAIDSADALCHYLESIADEIYNVIEFINSADDDGCFDRDYVEINTTYGQM